MSAEQIGGAAMIGMGLASTGLLIQASGNLMKGVGRLQGSSRAGKVTIAKAKFHSQSKSKGFMVRKGGRNVKWFPTKPKAQKYVRMRKRQGTL